MVGHFAPLPPILGENKIQSPQNCGIQGAYFYPRKYNNHFMNAVIPLPNYINGNWQPSSATEYLEVINPATTEILAKVPLSPASDVNQATEAAAEAFIKWRRTPAPERVQYLFKLKNLLEENFEDLARTITLECGKTLGESKRGNASCYRKCGNCLRHSDDDAGDKFGRCGQGY